MDTAIPGRYTIGVMAYDNLGNPGLMITANINVSGEVAQGITPLPPEEIQESPAEEPLPPEPPAVVEEPAPEPVTPVVVARQNSNCREGPDTAFDIYGTLFEAELAIITGRLSDNFWLRVTLPDRSSDCWVSASVVDMQGDLAEVAVVPAPPPPAAPPEAPAADDDADDDVDDDSDDAADDDSDDDSDGGGGGGDTTPPSFDTALSDDSISYAGGEVDSIVLAYDESGIKKISATWKLQGTDQSGSKTYGPIPNYEGAYFITLGPFNESGTLKINGTIVDKAGNKATFSQTVQVE